MGDALARMPAPAYLLDRNGVIRWENGKAIELFGDHRGRVFTELVAPEAASVARVEFTKKVLGSARTSDYESVLRTRSGGYVPVAIRAVALGDGDRIVGVFGLVSVDYQDPGQPLVPGCLTPRQQEVLRALSCGCSTAQIAESLGIARETVRNHVRGLLRALHANSRLEAIAVARRRGLID